MDNNYVSKEETSGEFTLGPAPWSSGVAERSNQEEILEYHLRLLRANNNSRDSMTPAMWLILEDARYSEGVDCNWDKWMEYLEEREK